VVEEAARDQLQRLAASHPAEYTAARELVTLLGGLPLALDQAGAYVEETACGLAGYLQRYTQQRPSMLNRRGGSSGAGHQESVSATFRLAYERIEREQPTAIQLLHACAFLHPEAIPEELFVEGAAHLGPELAELVGHATQFDQAIATLRGLSLLQRHPETRTFSLHRLVQQVLRDDLEAPVARQWSERVIRALNAAFPEPDFAQWPRCERYIPLVQIGLQLVAQAHLYMEEARVLFLKAGSYLLERGSYVEAEEFLAQANELGEHMQMDHDLVAADTLDRLATLYWRQAKYQQAERLFQRALAIGEQRLGHDHPQTAIYLNDLALLYYEQGKYRQAELFQQRALTVGERRPSPDLALTCDNMARILEAQGKSIQAEQLYQRALTIWELLPGPPHPSMTFCLNNVGMLYVKQRKYDLAEPLLRRALALRQQLLGPDHPRTAFSLQNLARLLREQGQYEEAIEMAQRALHIFEQRGGVDRSYLAKVLANLGVLSQMQGQDGQADSFLTRALRIQEQDLGQDHPDTATTLHHLAVLRQQQGKLNEARSLARRALKIRSQAQGVTHPDTMATQTLYAQLLGVHETEAAPNHTEEPPDLRQAEHLAQRIWFLPHEASDCSPPENDPLGAFLTACCERHPLAWCRSADLWRAYQQWTAQQHERYSLSRGAFIAQLKRHGCRADRTKTARIWRGIALASKQDDGR
jgi:tetratricopeptide (TPR) repeat protein